MWKSRLRLFVLGCAILLTDIVTKIITVRAFPKPAGYNGNVGASYQLFDGFFGIDLALTHAVNEGAAWGMFAQFPAILVAVRCILIAALIIYLFFFNQRLSWRVPLVLIISGALGNVIDYFTYGYVVDMIHFRFWGYDYPVFNVADSAIFIGSLWIIGSTFFGKSHER